MNNKKTECIACKWWILSITLGSMDKEIWHCRYGFLPSRLCQKQATHNEELIKQEERI